MSPGGTGCIYSTLFDVHIRLIFSRQYHINYTEGVFMSSGWAWCQFNVHIFSIFGRLYHINSETDMHIFSIFGRLYHINSETDMHIFSIFGRLYHINSQNIVYAFAPSRVLFKFLILWRKDCLRAIYRIIKRRIISVHQRVSIGCRTVPGGEGGDGSRCTEDWSAEAGTSREADDEEASTTGWWLKAGAVGGLRKVSAWR